MPGSSITPKPPERETSQPRILEEKEKDKAGKMAGEREVTFLSIITDIGNQGIIKTIQSLFAYIFSGAESSKTEDSDYVITVVNKEDSPARSQTDQIAGETLQGAASGPKDRAPPVDIPVLPKDPNKPLFDDIIEEMRSISILNEKQADNLIRAFESEGRKPIEEIKTRLDALVNHFIESQSMASGEWKSIQNKMKDFWEKKLAPSPNVLQQTSEVKSPQMVFTSVKRGRFPNQPPPTLPPTLPPDQSSGG